MKTLDCDKDLVSGEMIQKNDRVECLHIAMIVWVSLNRPIFDVTNRNRDRMGPVLGQGLKEISVLNSSNFELIPLDITGVVIL